MKYSIGILLLLLVSLFPNIPAVGEAVNNQNSIISSSNTAPPVERTKSRKKRTKKKKYHHRSKPFKQKKNTTNGKAWSIPVSIIGFVFLWTGLAFLPIIFLALLQGVNPFLFFLLPIIFIIIGILFISSAVHALSNTFGKNPHQLNKRKRAFGIAILIAGGLGILSAIAFGFVSVFLILAGIFNLIALSIPIMGILLGIFMVISAIPYIDQSYGTYADNPLRLKKQTKRQMIYSLIGCSLFAIAALFIFLMGAWIIALCSLAIGVGMLINAFIKKGILKKM